MIAGGRHRVASVCRVFGVARSKVMEDDAADRYGVNEFQNRCADQATFARGSQLVIGSLSIDGRYAWWWELSRLIVENEDPIDVRAARRRHERLRSCG